MTGGNTNTDLGGQVADPNSLLGLIQANGGVGGSTSKSDPVLTYTLNGQIQKAPLSQFWGGLLGNQKSLVQMQQTLQATGYLKYAHPTITQTYTALSHASKDFADYAKVTSGATLQSFFAAQSQGFQATSGTGGSGSGGSGDGTVTSIYEMSPDEAHYKLTQAMQQWLGRDPTQGEIQDFTNAVNQRALSEPTTVTTTGTKGDHIKQTQKGFSPLYAADSMAMQDAKSQPDYAAYQAATTYWNALTQSLNASVQGVGVV